MGPVTRSARTDSQGENLRNVEEETSQLASRNQSTMPGEEGQSNTGSVHNVAVPSSFDKLKGAENYLDWKFAVVRRQKGSITMKRIRQLSS